MGKIIAVANTKGGVGKSTTAVHLADWLSRAREVVFVNASFQEGVHPWLKELSIPSRQETDPDNLLDWEHPILAKRRKKSWLIRDGHSRIK